MSRPTVLVVDDEPALRAVVRGVLRMIGYDVREAVSGEEALAILEVEQPDAMLLDILLPGIDGWEVLARLAAQNRLASLPVLVLSASTGPAAHARAAAAGCRGFIEKPFQIAELVSRLQRVLPAVK